MPEFSVYEILDPLGRKSGETSFYEECRRGRILFCGSCVRQSGKSFLHAKIIGGAVSKIYFQQIFRVGRKRLKYETWLLSSPKGWKQIQRKLGACWMEEIPIGDRLVLADMDHLLLPWLLVHFPEKWASPIARFISTENNLLGTVNGGSSFRRSALKIRLKTLSRHTKLKHSSFQILRDRRGLKEVRFPDLKMRIKRSDRTEERPQFRWASPPQTTLLYSVPSPEGREKPFPFVSQDGTKLSGTIEMPKRHPSAVCILVHGSGIETRDSGCGFEGRDVDRVPAQPFRELSRKMAGNKIAVIRYDKRGVGKSGGLWPSVNRSALIMDLIAAIDRARALHPSLPIFLAGFSEGASLAISASIQRSTVAGIILAGSPGQTVDKVILEKLPFKLQSSGCSAIEIRQQLAAYRRFFSKIRKIGQAGVRVPDRIVDGHPLGWWVDHLGSPAPENEAKRVKCPVLILHGTNDAEVLPNQAKRLRKAFRRAKKAVILRWLKGLNHMFTPAFKPFPGFEYDIPFEIPEDVPKIISTWISEVQKSRRS